MRRADYVASFDREIKTLETLEYHDGGFSQFCVAHNIGEENGHVMVKPAENSYKFVFDPADKGFATIINQYDSPMDFAEITTRVDALVTPYNKEQLNRVKKMDTGGGGSNWFGGFKKITDGFDMISNGWEEGASRAELSLKNTQVPDIDGIESMRRNLVFSDYGETLNIDQAMAGNWEKAWQTCRRIRSGVSRVLSIAIPYGGNCNRSAEEMFWNGAQGMIITDILEDKGYRVQLYGVHFSSHPVNGAYVLELDLVNLKRSDEPLRMDSIAAVVAHAGVFRTAGFCSVVSKQTKIGSGLGRCIEENVQDGVKIAMSLGRMHPGTIALGGAYTKDAAVNSIVKFFDAMKAGAHNG